MQLSRHLHAWLATLLLIASPAVGGQVLSALHPCPVEAPWLDTGAGAPEGHGSEHAGHAHHAPDAEPEGEPGHGSHDCSCLGSCTTPALVRPDDAPVARLAAAPTPVVRRAVSRTGVAFPADRPHDLLPPQTAPPIA